MKMINIAFTDYMVVRMISLVAKYYSDYYIRPAGLDEESNHQVSRKTKEVCIKVKKKEYC